jgi:hypothetical protein
MSQPQHIAGPETNPMDRYIENRARFPAEELAKHAGKWIAFSPDGRCVLDSAQSLAALLARLEQGGQADVAGIVFERVPADGMILSGSELT